MICSDAGTQGARGGGTAPPQYMADQLTLFQSGEADYPHILLLPRPCQLQLRHIIEAGGCIYRLPPRAIELSDRVACLL